MIEAAIFAKHSEGTGWDNMADAQFQIMPRIGESIRLKVGHQSVHLYRVVAIHHPLEPAATVADIFIVHVGELRGETQRLWDES